MTIAVDWDIEHETKQTNKKIKLKLGGSHWHSLKTQNCEYRYVCDIQDGPYDSSNKISSQVINLIESNLVRGKMWLKPSQSN